MALRDNATKSTYIASVAGQANTAASHAIVIESGATNVVRIRRLVIARNGTQTTAGTRTLLLEHTTGAGTGGAVTAEANNATTAALKRLDAVDDVAFTGIVRAKPGTLGTQGSTILQIPIFVPTALAAFDPIVIDFDNGSFKGPRSLVGTANGIALRDPGAGGGAGFAAYIIFTEELP